MSVLEMKVPSPGESISEVEIAQWLVSDGDYVTKDQAIAEVDSDKATLELPAEESGIITLKAAEGDVVKVGQVVCLIDTSAAAPAGKPTEAVKVEAPKIEAETPAPKRKKLWHLIRIQLKKNPMLTELLRLLQQRSWLRMVFQLQR